MQDLKEMLAVLKLRSIFADKAVYEANIASVEYQKPELEGVVVVDISKPKALVEFNETMKKLGDKDDVAWVPCESHVILRVINEPENWEGGVWKDYIYPRTAISDPFWKPGNDYKSLVEFIEMIYAGKTLVAPVAKPEKKAKKPAKKAK